MAASREYTTLIHCTDKLISEISADPLTVANKLVTRGLIPSSLVISTQLQTKENQLKASELVEQVKNKVNTFPENFEVFLSSLDEFFWLQQLVKWIRKQYDETNSIKVRIS